MTATTRSFDPTALQDTLCVALELGEGRWKLGFGRGFGGIAPRRREERHAVREMKEDPSESPCRRRLQTAMSCFGPMTAVVNVMVKRRGKDCVKYG